MNEVKVVQAALKYIKDINEINCKERSSTAAQKPLCATNGLGPNIVDNVDKLISM